MSKYEEYINNKWKEPRFNQIWLKHLTKKEALTACRIALLENDIAEIEREIEYLPLDGWYERLYERLEEKRRELDALMEE